MDADLERVVDGDTEDDLRAHPPGPLLRCPSDMLDAPASEEDVARELAAIGERLAALAHSSDDLSHIGPEIGAIRAQLRLLADQNAEVRVRLATLLDDAD